MSEQFSQEQHNVVDASGVIQDIEVNAPAEQQQVEEQLTPAHELGILTETTSPQPGGDVAKPPVEHTPADYQVLPQTAEGVFGGMPKQTDPTMTGLPQTAEGFYGGIPDSERVNAGNQQTGEVSRAATENATVNHAETIPAHRVSPLGRIAMLGRRLLGKGSRT